MTFPKGYFDVSTAAMHCNVTIETIIAAIDAKTLKHIREADEIGIRLQELNKWRNAHLIDDTLIPSDLPLEIIKLGPAAFCGIYFLYLEGELQYVGQSVNVPSRVRDHHTNKRFDAAYFLPVPLAALAETERFYIQRLNPLLNRKMLDSSPA